MSRTNLLRLAGALVMALVLWAVLAVARRPPADRDVTLALPKIDSASVDSVIVTKLGDSAVVVRANRVWRVNGYPADSAAVAELLKALGDTSAWSELASTSAASSQRLGVGADSGERVRVVSHNRTVLDLVAGHRTSDYGGVYVRHANETAVYALHGSLGDPLTRGLDDWRDKRVVALVPDSVGTLDVHRGKTVYSLRRTGAGWQFTSGAAADSAAVANLVGQYRSLSASGFANRAQADSANFTTSKTRTRLLSKSGKPLASLVFDSTAAGVLTRADSGGAVFRIDAWTLNQLAPAESTLEAKKKK